MTAPTQDPGSPDDDDLAWGEEPRLLIPWGPDKDLMVLLIVLLVLVVCCTGAPFLW